MATHDDAPHQIKPDTDPVSRATFCTVCGRDLTEDEQQALREEAP